MSPNVTKASRRARFSPRPGVECLETRQVLSGNFPVAFPFNPGGFSHSIELSKLVGDTNNDGTVNLAEKNTAANGKYAFQGTLVGPLASFHGSVSIDILNAANVSIGQTTAIDVPPSSTAGTFSIPVLTKDLPSGTNALKLQIARIGFPAETLTLYPFSVKVDVVAPTLNVPADSTVEVTPGAGGAAVTFTGATATDNITPSPAITFKPASGTFLPVGTNTITATTRDQAGNSVSRTFRVTVLEVDRTPPSVTSIVPTSTKTGAKVFKISFSEAMANASVGRIQSFDIRLAGKDKKFGTKDDVRSRIVSALYDAASRLVTVTVAKAIPVAQTARVTIFGTGSFAVSDAAGNLLGGGDRIQSVKIPKAPKVKK